MILPVSAGMSFSGQSADPESIHLFRIADGLPRMLAETVLDNVDLEDLTNRTGTIIWGTAPKH